MGRFWKTDNFDGKFGVACQPSDDPKIFGMEIEEEIEEFVVSYYSSKETIPLCKKVLDKQYDILGIKDRVYHVDNNDELYKTIDRYSDMLYIPDSNGHYYYKGQTCREKFRGVNLALNRIFLGIAILSELKKNGFCMLEAAC